MKFKGTIAIAALTLVSFPLVSFGFEGSAKAQSFSCAQAQLPSEMAICNNESLLVKDEQVASLLAARLVIATTSGRLEDVSNEHGNWLRIRNTCANDMDCLEDVYDRRILGLTGRDL